MLVLELLSQFWGLLKSGYHGTGGVNMVTEVKPQQHAVCGNSTMQSSRLQTVGLASRHANAATVVDFDIDITTMGQTDRWAEEREWSIKVYSPRPWDSSTGTA